MDIRPASLREVDAVKNVAQGIPVVEACRRDVAGPLVPLHASHRQSGGVREGPALGRSVSLILVALRWPHGATVQGLPSEAYSHLVAVAGRVVERNDARSALEGVGPRKAQTRSQRARPTGKALGRSNAKNMPPEMWQVVACDRDSWREHEQHFVSAVLRRQASLTVPRGRFMIGPSPESADADERA